MLPDVSRAKGTVGLALLVCVVACAESRGPVAGGETHFLLRCDESAGCPEELSCVCGVCTAPCEIGDDCSALGDGAVCLAEDGVVDLRSGCSEAEREAPAVCELPCATDADCGDGQVLACMSGVCREREAREGEGSEPDAVPSGSSSSDTTGGDVLSGAAGAGPDVMLVVDTSGSMERRVACECADLACISCLEDGRSALPDCAAGERNRWATVLEVLTGSFDGFSCEALQRTPENGITYDEGYYLDYHRPEFDGQQADGVLDRYADRVRFGVATFDSLDTYSEVGSSRPLIPAEEFEWSESLGEAGMWSFGAMADGRWRLRPDGRPVGGVFYPGCTTMYFMDTGLRSESADEGWLVVPGSAGGAGAAQRSLLGVRPYGGTPIASSLDDLRYLFERNASVADSPPRYAVLITDGYPDDDYRALGCECTQNDDPARDDYCGGPPENVDDCDDPEQCPNHPDNMLCPYPTADDAARALVSVEGAASPPLRRLFVVAFSIPGADLDVLSRLDALAAAGGSDAARRADSADELRQQLESILDSVAGAP